MTFPTVPTQAAGRLAFVNQLDTVATLTGPNLNTLTMAPDDLLIALAGEYQSNAGADAAFTGWAGGGLTWTEIRDSTGTADNRLGVAYARVVTGTETGTVTVTRSGTLVGDASMIVLVVPGAHPTTAPEATAVAVGLGATLADPAALTPSWGAEDTLWVGVNGNGMTNATGTWTANNSAPTNYTDYVGTAPADTSTIGDFGLAVAFRQLNAASEDMGPFGQDTSNARSAALLVAVRPLVLSAITLADSGGGAGVLAVGAAVPVADQSQAADTLVDLPAAEELFLRADAGRLSGLADNDPVTAWPATFGRQLTQATGTLQPTFQTGELNGRPVVRFDAGDSLATAPFAAAAQPVTVFMVVRFGTQLATRYLFDGVDGTDRLALFLNASGQVELFAGVSLIGPAPAAGETVVYTAVFNGASSAIYKNGTLVASGNGGGNSLAGLTVGSRYTTTEFLDGDLAEVAATRELLSTGRRQAVESYLTGKWVSAASSVTLTDAAAAADTLQPVAQVTVGDRGQGNDTPPPVDPLARTDLIYGSEIGAWLPDGEPAVTVAPRKALDARIPVIRFALHDTFTDLLDPLGNAGQITRADFRHVIGAIVNDFHAIPWLKCLPIAKDVIGTKAGNIWCPPWTGTIPAVWLNTYKAMLDEVAKVWRGPIIIESNNEMEYACWETWRDRDGATLTGAGNAGVSTRIGQHYAQTMGELRRYARGLGFSHVVVGGYIGVAGGPQWGATITADGSKPYSYAFSNLGTIWVDEFANAVKAAYDAEPAGTKADLVPDFIAVHAYSHGGDFATSGTGYEFTGLTGYDASRPDDIAYSYYRQWLTNARARMVAIWGATIGNQIRLAMSEWNAGLANSSSTWSGWTTTGRPGQFYRGWMTMLAGDGVTTGSGTRWWEASMFLLASESDSGASRYYNTVKQDGTVQVWYYDFRAAAAADPATATGVGPAVTATLPLAEQGTAAELLGVPLFKTLVDVGIGVEAMAGVLTVTGTLLTAGSSAAASSSYLTGSVSPAAGTVLLVWVEHGGTATLPTVAGLGATWTRQGSVAYGDGTRVLSAHTAPMGPSPGSGQLTISGGPMTHAVWSVVQLTDADPTTPVVGSPASGTATAASSLTVPLAAAAAAGNRPFAGFAADDSTPTQTSPRAGWTELSETVA